MNLARILNLEEFESAARRHLPPPVFEYIAGAVEENLSRGDNRAAFSEWGFAPRVLRNTTARTTRTEIFGQACSAPFGIAPMGMSSLSAYRGDIVQARGARAAGIPMILSGTSLIRLEDVIAENPDTWFQAYLPGEPERIAKLVDRVAAAGYRTLVVTVDVAVLSVRETAVRAGFSTPLRPTLRLAWDGITHPRWTFGTFLRTFVQHGMPHFENSFAERGAPLLASTVQRDFSGRDQLDWSSLAAIRGQWKGKLVVKGVMTPDDTRIARDAGADGIIVSNHGGRQLDGTVSPLRVLPAIVEEAGAMVVMMDSGVRRGTDVLKALALGAKFVFVGRPFNYAASIAGEAGIARAFTLLQGEIQRSMGLLGVNTLAEVTPELLRRLR
jgi:L-lactate dehydrogenase (cytochrome)